MLATISDREAMKGHTIDVTDADGSCRAFGIDDRIVRVVVWGVDAAAGPYDGEGSVNHEWRVRARVDEDEVSARGRVVGLLNCWVLRWNGSQCAGRVE